jgi:ribonuclease HI
VGESEQFYKNVPSDSAPSTTAVWKAPTGDKLKINTDGAFDVVRKTGGWGFVVRDNTGQIRGAGAVALQLVASAGQAEAYACEEVVRSAADWGMVDVSIKTDAWNLVRALHGTEFDRTLE